MRTVRNILTGVCVVLANCGTPSANADFTFGTPVNVGSPINTLQSEDVTMCVSADGLSLYFSSDRPGGVGGGWDLYVTTKTSIGQEWGPAVNLGANVNSSNDEWAPSISADGLSLYFTSGRPGGCGEADLWVTTRASVSDPWSVPVNLGGSVNGSQGDENPSISADGLSLFFDSNRERVGTSHPQYCYIYMTTRPTKNDPWGIPVRLGPTVNPGLEYDSGYPSISADGRMLVFAGNLPGRVGGWDLWITRRATKDDEWAPPVNLGPEVNSAYNEEWPQISSDGRTLYFSSWRPGGSGGSYGDIYQAPIVPVVDFNGDGKVDGNEVLAIAQHWGENYPTCDIAPFAWGDSVVDVNDLTVLAGYIGQEVNDPTLIAHWGLDETEGMLATDSAGGHDAMVMGNAAWQPSGGKIGGALAFDGKDDLLRSLSSVLDPSNGPFSVIAWVKGGAPNRVIMSQFGAADWLYLNQYGMLTTDLMSSDRKNGKSLTSSAFVIDDQWHRVALVWDGTNRALHMDGVEVARDTQPNLAASGAILQIGTGKNGAPTPFWTGVIDDVRIYNRVVAP